jgi:hypothetical protein
VDINRGKITGQNVRIIIFFDANVTDGITNQLVDAYICVRYG